MIELNNAVHNRHTLGIDAELRAEFRKDNAIDSPGRDSLIETNTQASLAHL